MEIINLNTYIESRYETAVALGNFDGLHLGHQHLIKDNIKRARDANLRSSILLFKNHTKTILENQKRTKIEILTSYEQKLNMLAKLGVDLVYALNFDKDIMRLSADEFIERILLRELKAKLVTIGFDYKFGYKAAGDNKYLKSLGKRLNFNVNIIEPIYLNNKIISSTLIRELIKSGDIRLANNLLGWNFSLIGKVVKGYNIGEELGFPTANIELINNYVVPKQGVYRTITYIDNYSYQSLTNIGCCPTFQRNEFKIENYILRFDGNIYDKIIKIEIIDYIRNTTKFNSAQELINQIEADVKDVGKTNNIYNFRFI